MQSNVKDRQLNRGHLTGYWLEKTSAVGHQKLGP